MQSNLSRFLVPLSLFALGLASGSLWFTPPSSLSAQSGPPAELVTRLVRQGETVRTNGSWGEWLRYFRGDSHGTSDMVVLAVTLKPGQAPHPPHEHAEEELMLLTAGEGTWHVSGNDLPAKQGDVVYAAPWTLHGLENTSAAPLTYYMVKWSGKCVPVPQRPAVPAPDATAHLALTIAGAWDAEDRHLAMGSLFEPVHDTRQRRSTVYFEQDGDRIKGWSLTPHPERISGQERWKDGKTTFRSVQLRADNLVFEFDVDEIHHGWKGASMNKGFVRVEARWKGDRLVGQWFMFCPDGSEPFRGEWEAERAAPSR